MYLPKAWAALLLSLLLLCAFGASAQQRLVQGTVKDPSGEALIGATILLKGTTTGSTADAQGAFSIQVPNNTSTLVVSFTGMNAQTVAVGEQTTLPQCTTDAGRAGPE